MPVSCRVTLPHLTSPPSVSLSSTPPPPQELPYVKGTWRACEERTMFQLQVRAGTRGTPHPRFAPPTQSLRRTSASHTLLTPPLLRLHSQDLLGNHWSDLVTELPGREDNAVKNRYYSACVERDEWRA